MKWNCRVTEYNSFANFFLLKKRIFCICLAILVIFHFREITLPSPLLGRWRPPFPFIFLHPNISSSRIHPFLSPYSRGRKHPHSRGKATHPPLLTLGSQDPSLVSGSPMKGIAWGWPQLGPPRLEFQLHLHPSSSVPQFPLKTPRPEDGETLSLFSIKDLLLTYVS